MGPLSTGNASRHLYFRNLEIQNPFVATPFENDVLFKEVPVGIVYADSSGNILLMNPFTAQLSGYHRQELQGVGIDSIIRENQRSESDLKGTGPDPQNERPICIRRKDGGVLHGWLKKIPLKRGDAPKQLLIFWPAARMPSQSPCDVGSTAPSPKERAQAHEDQIIGESEEIRGLCELCSQIADTECTVLIQGESGTGKELFASTIHHHSGRADAPFVRLNCVAISETLLESELFGHVKGAFTGAYRSRKGRFQSAEKGTILLDEIGSMSLAGQAKLLRVIQEREFEPVGSSQSIACDVRIIATSNIDLIKAVQKGGFREDLYYRLSVFKLDLPSLKARKQDIPLLAAFFLEKYAAKMHKTVVGFDPEAMACMLNYDWPGNVRELKNVVEHVMVVAKRDYIFQSDLPGYLTTRQSDPPQSVNKDLNLRRKLEIIERQIVLQTLQKEHWIKKNAARQLGIDPRNFNYFLKKHKIVHSA